MEIDGSTLAMVGGLVVLGGGGVALALKWKDIRARSGRKKVLEQVGGVLALKPTQRRTETVLAAVMPGLVFHECWEGTVDGFSVRVTSGEKDGRSILEADISLPESLVGGLALTQQFHDSLLPKLAGTRVQDVITGDAVFDDKLAVRAVQGHLVRGLLRHGLRETMLALGDASWLMAILPNRALMVWREDAEAPLLTSKMVPQLKQLLSVLEELRKPADPFEKLAELVRTDPDSWVRRRAVEALARRYQGHSGLEEQLRLAMQDKDWLVRLAAARALGPAALETFASMLHVAPRPWPEFVVSAVAELNNPVFLPVLRSALGSSIPAVLAVGRLRDVESASRLIKCYDLASSVEHKQAILEVLEALGSIEAQELLLRQVQDPELAPSLRQAAVQALGVCGDGRALDVLTPLSKVVVGGGLRSVALQSIAAIQARAGMEQEGDWAATREERWPDSAHRPGNAGFATPFHGLAPEPPTLDAAAKAVAMAHDVTALSLGATQSEALEAIPPHERSLEQEAYDAGLVTHDLPVSEGNSAAGQGRRGPSTSETDASLVEAASAPGGGSKSRAELKQALAWMDDALLPPGEGRGPR